MSNVGQAALVVVGTAVGTVVGNPQLGYLIGSLAGQALFPTQLPGQEGPRLSDLSVQSSAIGGPIPIIYGTFAVAGNVIWSSGLIESSSTEEVGGKGGPPSQDVTTYSYATNAAIGLCEGTIGGVRRIWADAKLVYDRRELQPGESDTDYATRIAASDAFASYFTVYLGTESQLADPTIESFEGSGLVPAYRGLAYIVFADLPLADYGNRLPNFRVEVYVEGLADCETVTEYSNLVLDPWVEGGSLPLADANVHTYTVIAAGKKNRRVSGTFDSLSEATAAANNRTGKHSNSNYFGYSLKSDYRNAFWGLCSGMNPGSAPTVQDYDAVQIQLHYNAVAASLGSWDRGAYPGSSELFANTIVGCGPEDSFHSNWTFTTAPWAAGDAGVYVRTPGTYVPPAPAPGEFAFDRCITGGSNVLGHFWLSTDMVIGVERVPRAPDDVCAGGTLDQFPGFCIDADGKLTQDTPWTLEAGTFRVLQRYTTATVDGVGVVATYPLNPCLPNTDADYSSQAFWEAAYTLAVASGDMPEGLVYGVDYPKVISSAYVRTVQRCAVSVDEVGLAFMVQDLCRRAGLDYTLVDTTDLTDSVRGYAVSRVMTARAAIEPLRSYGFFDAVESDGRLKFVSRGAPEVATLEEADLGAHQAGEGRPSAVEVERIQDVELPRRLRLHYAMADRNYEPGEQGAQRLTARAVQVVDVELTVAIDDADAAKVAEVLLYDAWIGRTTYRFTLDHTWLALEPTDCITIPVDGQQERVRIVSIDHQLPNLLKVEAVRDDDGSYVSYAVGGALESVVPALQVLGPTELTVLDLPALQDADDDAGYYAAARGLLSSSGWPGAVILRSEDGGTSFLPVGTILNAAAQGVLLAPLGTGPSTVFDYTHELLVKLKAGTLESRTEAAVLAGANAAAIGAHGRWEVVQFTTATLDGDFYRLTGLLRGRRGTEVYIGDSEAGDKFVLLSAGGIIRIPLDTAKIGTELVLRASTLGVPQDLAQDQAFSGAGEALRPFAPAQLEAVLQEDGTLLITWLRRGRLGQELPSGTDIALSEESESYDVQIVEDGETIDTATVAVQQYTAALTSITTELQVGGAFLGAALVVENDGTFYGVTDSFYTPTAVSLQQFNEAGERIGGVNLGTYAVEVLAIGGFLYPAFKSEGDQARVVRLDPALIVSNGPLPDPLLAEYEPPGSDDLSDLAYTGTDLWALLRTTGELKRLNLTTLAVEQTITVPIGGYQLAYGGESLWVLYFGSVTQVGITGSPSGVVQSFEVTEGLYDILYSEGLVFVHGSQAVGVYDAATGAEVALHPLTLEISAFGARKLADDGTEFVVFADPSSEELVFLSRTTGLEVTRRPLEDVDRVVGYAGGTLFASVGGSTLGGGAGAAPFRTVGLSVAARGPYEITVWQRSATIGRGHPATLTVEVQELQDGNVPDVSTPVQDEGALILPLVYSETELTESLPIVRQNDGPRITQGGFVGDGYEARLLAATGGSPGLPTFITGGGAQAVTLRVSARVDARTRNADRDVIVSLCTASNERPKIELAVLADSRLANAACVAFRMWDSALRTTYLARPEWRYEFRTPDLTNGSGASRPQSVEWLEDGRLLFVTHFQETESRVYAMAPDTLEVLGQFSFEAPIVHVGGCVQRPSDGSVWFVDFTTGKVLQVDLEASLLSGVAVLLTQVVVTTANRLSVAEWVEVDGVEYFLWGEYATAFDRWIYLMDPADLIDGTTWNVADRIKRLIAPLLLQGMLWRESDGALFLPQSNITGGIIELIDVNTWIRTGADGDNYATYQLDETYYPPHEQAEDISFDAEGRLWMPIEGLATPGDGDGYLSTWSTDLTGPADNSYSVEYDGAGTYTLKINDQPFQTVSRTPTISPDTLVIGGPANTAAGWDAGYMIGQVRNLIIQEDPLSYTDRDDSRVYETRGNLREVALPLVNPSAETGDTTGWTNELGTLAVDNQGPDPIPGQAYYFDGGTDTTTLARQRFLLADLELSAEDIDGGLCWAVVTWYTARSALQPDTASLGFRFLDDALATIATEQSTHFDLTVDDTWYRRSYGVQVPAGTRSVDLLLELVKNLGANNNGNADLIEARIYVQDPFA